MTFRTFRFLFLCLAAGLQTAYAAPLNFTQGVTVPSTDRFGFAVFQKVLSDTQDQAKFAQKILGDSYKEPSRYEGTVSLSGIYVDYVAEHGYIDWTVQGTGLSDRFDALSYIHSIHSGQPSPKNLYAAGITIIVIGVTCAYLDWVATNNCIRACGADGVLSTSYTCGAATSSAGCVCKPHIRPEPTPPPYPGGPYGTGPYFDGYEEPNCYTVNTPGECDALNSISDTDKTRGKMLGQGWMAP